MEAVCSFEMLVSTYPTHSVTEQTTNIDSRQCCFNRNSTGFVSNTSGKRYLLSKLDVRHLDNKTTFPVFLVVLSLSSTVYIRRSSLPVTTAIHAQPVKPISQTVSSWNGRLSIYKFCLLLSAYRTLAGEFTKRHETQCSVWAE
jgi:hypothetical protein